MIAARQIFLGRGGAKLPYDAEVEWLSSGGTAYIDSGVLACDGIGFAVTAKAGNSWTIGYPTGWSNDYEPSHATKWTFFAYTASQYTGLRYAVGLGRLNYTGVNVGNAMNTRFVTWGIDTYTGNLTFDGEVKASNLSLPLDKPSPFPTLKVFAINTSNSNTAPVISNDVFKISHMVFTVDGAIVRDFIPVRFTNEQGQTEGAMYDRVSGQLFRNQGTGTFIIGNDK